MKLRRQRFGITLNLGWEKFFDLKLITIRVASLNWYVILFWVSLHSCQSQLQKANYVKGVINVGCIVYEGQRKQLVVLQRRLLNLQADAQQQAGMMELCWSSVLCLTLLSSMCWLSILPCQTNIKFYELSNLPCSQKRKNQSIL